MAEQSMVYRLLLIGTNKPQVTEFFNEGREFFQCLTSSMRKDDLSVHLDIAEPHAVVCCLNVEKDEDLNAINSILPKLKKMKIPLITLGTKDGCGRFERIVCEGDLNFGHKYIPPRTMYEQLCTFINDFGKQKDYSRRQSILVVDDDPIMLKVIKEYLHEEFDTAVAVSGKVALKYLETHSPDLVLLDYEMPELNGPQVLERIRMDEKTMSIPVVFLTGQKDTEKVREAVRLKPQGYLLKPCEKQKLIEAIKKILL
ncbi:MAG: response regulator [Treponema sp.]|nr:response regulator [Treponema sp.]